MSTSQDSRFARRLRISHRSDHSRQARLLAIGSHQGVGDLDQLARMGRGDHRRVRELSTTASERIRWLLSHSRTVENDFTDPPAIGQNQELVARIPWT